MPIGERTERMHRHRSSVHHGHCHFLAGILVNFACDSINEYVGNNPALAMFVSLLVTEAAYKVHKKRKQSSLTKHVAALTGSGMTGTA